MSDPDLTTQALIEQARERARGNAITAKAEREPFADGVPDGVFAEWLDENAALLRALADRLAAQQAVVDAAKAGIEHMKKGITLLDWHDHRGTGRELIEAFAAALDRAEARDE